MHEKFFFHKAMLWIVASMLATTALFGAGLLYMRHVKSMHAHDDAFRIVAIVQSTTNKEALKTVYLAELLDLSMDHPTNLYQFNTKEAQRKLLASPLIKEATIKKIRPGTLFINYSVRQPIAFLGEFENSAIDAEATPFPFHPFFTSKKLPEIYIGISELIWGEQIQGKEITLALRLLALLNEKYSKHAVIKRIDVSNAYAAGSGQRQIVVELDLFVPNGTQSIALTLRLPTKGYEQALANYAQIRDNIFYKDLNLIQPPEMMIDLRLDQLAFVTKLAFKKSK